MEPLECLEIEAAESPIISTENSFHMPQHLSEIPRSWKSKNEKCNLRKSLAWDSAFFTSAGVLDHDELTIMMEGVKINDNHSLSTIPEDLRVSGESISTLDSDCLDLHDTDVDIFHDIRASIQKSSRPPKSANSVIQPCPFSDDLDQDDHDLDAKKMDIASPNTLQVKPKAGSKASNCKGASHKIIKQSSVHPSPPQPASKEGHASPFPKPARMLRKSPFVSSTQTTRTIKNATNNDKVANVPSGKCPQVLKISGSGTSSKPDTRGGKFLSKSLLGYSLSKLEPTTSSCSIESYEVSRNIKLSSTSQRKRMGDKSSCVPPSPASISKAPATKSTSLRYKSKPGTSNLGNFLKSNANNTQNVSPASSISEWSCESSSSCTVNQKPIKSKVGGDPTSIPEKKICVSVSTSQVSEAFKSHNNQPSHLASTRPSGLRMPSPKIGFFDGVKTSGYTLSVGNIRPPMGKTLATTTSLSKNASTYARNPSGDSTKGISTNPKKGDILKLQKPIPPAATRSSKDVKSVPPVANVQKSPTLKNEGNLTQVCGEKCPVKQVPLVDETVSADSMNAHNKDCGNRLKVDPLMSGTKMFESSSSFNDIVEINGCQKEDQNEIGSQNPPKDEVMGKEIGFEESQNSITKASQFAILSKNSELSNTVRVPLASKNSFRNVAEPPDFNNALPEDSEKAATPMLCTQTSADENSEFCA